MMDFGFSEQQDMLRTMARDFLIKSCPKSKVRELDKDEKGYDPRIWKDMAGLGWQGLVFPEEFGGTGAQFMDLVILTEEMGRNILPGPFFSTIALCALPILEFGTKEQKSRFLPPVASGETILSLALIEENGGYNPSQISMQAIFDGNNYVLKGEKIFVSDAHVANYLLVAARTTQSNGPESGITFFLVDAEDTGIKLELIPTMGGDRQFRASLNSVIVSANNILGEAGDGVKILDFLLQRASILKSAEIYGACQAVLDMTSAYAKERIQFNRPIGSFQAVQHKLADMLIDVECLEYLLYQAAWEISSGQPSPLHISAVKAMAAEAYQNICVEGITSHGAIGFTMDCDIGLYYRRVRASEFAAGNTALHLEKIAASLGL